VTLVIDASVMAAVITQEAGSEAARIVVAPGGLIAPDLLLAETANLLWKKARRGLIRADEAPEALAMSLALLERIVPIATLHEAALSLSLRRDHPAYDCFYVALAQREGVPLVTADAKLARDFAADAEIRLLQPSASA
jgi:predicted nucleic acid-binding protein